MSNFSLRLKQQDLNQAAKYMVLCLALFIGLSTFYTVWAGGEKMWTQLSSVTFSIVGFMLILSIGNYGLRCLRWHICSSYLNVKIPWYETILFYMTGFVFSTSPVKLGEAFRVWFIHRRHNHSVESLLPMFVADKISDLHAMLLLCLLTVLNMDHFADLTLIASIILLLISIVFFRPLWLVWAINKVCRRVVSLKTLGNKVIEVLHLGGDLLSSKAYIRALLCSIVGWVLEGVALYLLLSYFNLGVTLSQAIFMFCFATVVGAVSMMPGGLGGFEAALITLLSLKGSAMDVAVTVTVIIRLTSLWFAIALGFLFLPKALSLAKFKEHLE